MFSFASTQNDFGGDFFVCLPKKIHYSHGSTASPLNCLSTEIHPGRSKVLVKSVHFRGSVCDIQGKPLTGGHLGLSSVALIPKGSMTEAFSVLAFPYCWKNFWGNGAVQ